jgi:PKD repeat protein
VIAVLVALSLTDVTQESFAIPTTVGPLPRVMQRLTEVTKTPYRVHGSMVEEVAALGTPSIPLSETMEKLAQITEATWTRDTQGYLLFRTDAQIKARQQREFETNVRRIEAQFQKTRTSLDGMGDFTDMDAKALATAANQQPGNNDVNFWRKRQALTEKAPATRLANRLMLTLTPQTLAKIPENGRVVFSSNPTRMQVKFDGKADAAIRQFLTDQTKYAEAASAMAGEDQGYFHTYDGLSSNRAVGKIGKVLYIISRAESFGQSYSATLKVSNDKGQIMVTATNTIMASSMSEAGDEWMKPPPAVEGDLPIAPSEASEGMMQLFRDMQARNGQMAGMPKMSPAFKNFLLRPDQNDPVALGNQEAIETIVAKQNQPVAMILNDISFFGVVRSAMDKKFTRSRWEGGFKMSSMEKVADPKWVLVRLETPLSAERSRLSRTLLAKFLTRTSVEGRVSLDNMAQLALGMKTEINNTILPLYMMLIGSDGDTMMMNGDSFWLKMYGTLTAEQRRALEQNQTIGRLALSPKQMSLIEEKVFRGLRQFESMEAVEVEKGSGEHFMGEMLSNEPTEAFANGLPDNLVLGAQVAKGETLFSKTDAFFGGTRAVDENAIAWDVYQRERPDLFTYVSQMPQMKDFYKGTQSTWNLDLTVGKTVLRGTLRDDVVGDKKMSFLDLPAEFRKKVDDAIARHRETYKDMKPGEFGGPGGRAIPPLQ